MSIGFCPSRTLGSRRATRHGKTARHYAAQRCIKESGCCQLAEPTDSAVLLVVVYILAQILVLKLTILRYSELILAAFLPWRYIAGYGGSGSGSSAASLRQRCKCHRVESRARDTLSQSVRGAGLPRRSSNQAASRTDTLALSLATLVSCIRMFIVTIWNR